MATLLIQGPAVHPLLEMGIDVGRLLLDQQCLSVSHLGLITLDAVPGKPLHIRVHCANLKESASLYSSNQLRATEGSTIGHKY